MTTEQPISRSTADGDTTPIRDLRTEYGLACPDCGQAETLAIEISCSADLTIDGTEPRGDHYWDDTSSCFCDECGTSGAVAEFRAAGGKAVQA